VRGRDWLLLSSTVALIGAAIATYCLSNYPAIAVYSPWSLAAGLLLLTLPIVCATAVAKPNPATLASLHAHAAFFTAFLVVDLVVAGGVWSILVLVLVAEALLAEATRLRVKKAAADGEVPFVYVGLTTALLAGWFAGFLIWSAMLPRQIIAAAEAAAGDRPYCIDVGEKPAQTASDLSGLSTRAATNNGWTLRFHALLVIGEAAHRRYMNWSYRTGRFEPVSDYAREGLHLDGLAKCAPKARLAHDWL